MNDSELKRDAERWRKARQLISATEIEEAAEEVASGDRRTDEDFNVLTDAAIDAVMNGANG